MHCLVTMKKLSLLVALLLTPSLWATTFNVNSTMSETAIQSTVNTAGGSTGNTVTATFTSTGVVGAGDDILFSCQAY